MYRQTLNREIQIEGPSLFCPLKTAIVNLFPTNLRGIYFSDSDKKQVYSLDSLHANQSANGARYLKIGQKNPTRVPEHLLSALFWAGITDLEIECRDRELPSYGPGIFNFYDKLITSQMQNKQEVQKRVVAKSAEFRQSKNGLETVITAEPFSKLSIKVVSARYPDLIDLDEESFELQDAYQEAPRHLKARALARLMDPKKYFAWKVLTFMGYRGITEENYVLTKPGETSEQIRGKMAKLYQKHGNEHLAHTAVCDFPGELLAVGSHIQGRFTLSNTNHLTRVAAIKEFFSQGVFQTE